VHYHERPPSPDLAPYVRCLWELDAPGAALTEPIFPDGCMELVVHLGDIPRRADHRSPQPAVMIVGQMIEATRLDAPGRVHAIGVRFTPAGARSWLGVPLHLLAGRFEDGRAVRSAAADRVRVAIESAAPRERFARLEDALRSTLRTTAVCRVHRVVTEIERRGGAISVDALARASGVSARQLERRFQDAVGLPPKPFARIVRFQRALRGLRAGVRAADVAAACGFADQAHLAREFRRVAGVPASGVTLGDVAFVQDAAPAGLGQ
jgi:AraC-like DNA-binding protein